MHEIFCTYCLLFLWADPVTLKLNFAHTWLTYRWLLKVQTHMHQRQTRSSSVTVSACTVPDCQTWSVYRATARVPTNQTWTVPVARERTRFYSFTLLEFAAEWEDSNQSNESSTMQYTCARVRVAAKILLQNSRETVPVMEGWGAPLICKQPEAYTCGVQKGNMAEVKKVAALFTLLFSLWSKFCVVYYPMTWTSQHICKLALYFRMFLYTVRTITVFMCYFQCPLASTWH